MTTSIAAPLLYLSSSKAASRLRLYLSVNRYIYTNSCRYLCNLHPYRYTQSSAVPKYTPTYTLTSTYTFTPYLTPSSLASTSIAHPLSSSPAISSTSSSSVSTASLSSTSSSSISPAVIPSASSTSRIRLFTSISSSSSSSSLSQSHASLSSHSFSPSLSTLILSASSSHASLSSLSYPLHQSFSHLPSLSPTLSSNHQSRYLCVSPSSVSSSSSSNNISNAYSSKEGNVRRNKPVKAEENNGISLDSYESYKSYIQCIINNVIGDRRDGEFKSLRVVNRSICVFHCLFLLLLLLSPPTSLELLLTPHAQLSSLSLAHAASITFWGFTLANPAVNRSAKIPLAADWRLLIGLLYFYTSVVCLLLTQKSPILSYSLLIPSLLILIILNKRMIYTVPSWWGGGSNIQMLFTLLFCLSGVLARAVYVHRNAEAVLERDSELATL